MLYDNRKEMPDDRIVIDPEIAHGKPVIKGTRVSVEIILGSLAGGMDIKEVADEYCLERRRSRSYRICGQDCLNRRDPRLCLILNS